ncbi:MAG: DNA mismatch repair protein MutL, partial [Firmicutes bacterium]|nr:DNA mismatch repair protein MutL [Bacillota bacterium]
HAAHERIMYEHLLYKFNSEDKLSQVLLAPILIKTTPAQTAGSESWIPLLDSIGFVIENFGPNQFVIKQIPAALKLEEAESFVNSVLESDIDNPGKVQEKKDAIIMASCKAAVKSGDKLSTEEILRLFEDLDKCENPFSCPHGRPTFLRFSEGQIEHFFKRK